jgi:predicted 2-oxoglutarate/Fe(II)-dependent dioxygenase YbiX
MKNLSAGIVLFENTFLRDEELIDLAEQGNWREGTAGGQINPQSRITDIHDLDTSTELHNELLETFVNYIGEYMKLYPNCKITKGEHLRIGRYYEQGHYKPHCDSSDSSRILSGVLYLNDDYEGGELLFNHLDLKIKPNKGDLILFPSNYVFTHESLPVTKGTKYIALSWFG